MATPATSQKYFPLVEGTTLTYPVSGDTDDRIVEKNLDVSATADGTRAKLKRTVTGSRPSVGLATTERPNGAPTES